MKSTTVRGLRNNCSQGPKWVAHGEEVEVTRRGKIVAKLVPVTLPSPSEVDRSKNAAINHRAWSKVPKADESVSILAENQEG